MRIIAILISPKEGYWRPFLKVGVNYPQNMLHTKLDQYKKAHPEFDFAFLYENGE